MPKIAFVGAGSAVFTRNLVGDVLSHAELRDDTTFSLMDIDAERLRTAEIVTARLVEAHGAGAHVAATQDRRAALDGADYVVTSFQVGGYKPSTVVDFEVPKRYGLRQTIADTLGVGGIMRGLRTIPVLLDVCRDLEELCPDALLLNYVNPMAMLCWAVAEASPIRTVGLCHSVQGTTKELAHDLGLPAQEIDQLAAGINHMAFFLRFEHRGADLYPALRELEPAGRQPRPLRGARALRLLRHRVLGALRRVRPVVHQGRSRGPDRALQRAAGRVPASLRAPDRRVGGAARRARGRRRGWPSSAATSTGRTSSAPARPASRIASTATSRTGTSDGLLIDNLPADCCVEVPCIASDRGIDPQPVGALPRQLAALMQTNVNVQGLTVEAALTGRREAVHQAAMLDPHTAAELSLDEIAALVDELLREHGDWVPEVYRPRQP